MTSTTTQPAAPVRARVHPPAALRRRWERWLGLAAIAFIAVAWVAGAVRAEADLLPAIRQALPAADTFERVADGLYAATQHDTGALIGYVAVGTGSGYGGPLRVAVGVSPAGEVLGVALADQKETPAWLRRVTNADFLEGLPGKTYTDGFDIGSDLDGVTGATYTTRAIAEAVLAGSRAVAAHLGLPVAPAPPPAIKFGLPEIVLLTLFAVGFVGHQRSFKYKGAARWASMLVGLVVLGFVYNSPVTLAYMTKLLLGYWPQWQTNLYWYFLIGGILFVFTVDNKNPYCEWFCPFGAAQECMGLIGGAKPRRLRRGAGALAWLQRGLALSAILLGVYFRSPGLASFEVFGTLFGLVGSPLQFVVLGLVLAASLFIKRPWCSYLCPVHPVVELIRGLRNWAKELWHSLRLKPSTA